MTLQNSGAITFANIQNEFGGSNPISLNEYYGADSGIPNSGQISMNQFYGKSDTYSTILTVGHNNFEAPNTGFALGKSPPFNTSNPPFNPGTARPSFGSFSNPLWIDGTSRILGLFGSLRAGIKVVSSYELRFTVEGLHAQNSFNTLICGFGTYQTSQANTYHRSDLNSLNGFEQGTGVNGSNMYGPTIFGVHCTIWYWVTNSQNVQGDGNTYGRTRGTPTIGGVGTTHTITVT